MTGIITSLPPLVEQPPGNNASNPAGLPGVTYTAAIPILPQTWTGLQTYTLGSMQFAGSTSGNTFLNAAAIASGVLTLPAATDTLVGRNTTDTLTNKTLTSPVFVTPNLGVATATSINKYTFTTPATGATLTILDGKTATINNTLTFAGTDGSTLNVGAGGTLGSNAYTSTAYAPLASPTFTGVVTYPTPFTLGATSVTSTGTQLNYLNAATGTTGTPSTNLVFSTSPTLVTPTLGAATATTLNGNTFTTGTYTLTGTAGKTFTFNNSLTLAGVDAKTLTINNSLTLSGTDATVQTFPSTSGTVITSVSTASGDLTGTYPGPTIAANAVTNAKMATMAAFTFKGNNTSGTATPTDVDISLLTAKASPVATDLVMISDQAAAGAWKKVTVSSLASAGSVSSIAGNTGAFTLSTGITNVGNDIRFNPTAAATVNVVKVQKFTASGTYTPSAGIQYAIIECLGGGGGGGGAAAVAAGTGGSAGGGGAGSYSRKYVSAATIGASQTVTIGGAGVAGAGAGVAGGAGGDTSVGTLCIGKGASGGAANAAGGGGAGGVAGTGDVTLVGNAGGQGATYGIVSISMPVGAGASSIFGGAPSPANIAAVVTGASAQLYGSGGNGGASWNGGAAAAGGAGSAGIVIITEYTNQ